MNSKLDEIKKLAHDIAAGRSGNHADRASWYIAITKAAEAQRKPQESTQQSFARYVTEDADGKAMLSAYKTASGADFRPAEPTPAPAVKNSAAIEIAKLADELREGKPEMTRSAALAKVWADRPELAARAKAEAA